jgi:hypothetical protein
MSPALVLACGGAILLIGFGIRAGSACSCSR